MGHFSQLLCIFVVRLDSLVCPAVRLFHVKRAEFAISTAVAATPPVNQSTASRKATTANPYTADYPVDTVSNTIYPRARGFQV